MAHTLGVFGNFNLPSEAAPKPDFTRMAEVLIADLAKVPFDTDEIEGVEHGLSTWKRADLVGFLERSEGLHGALHRRREPAADTAPA